MPIQNRSFEYYEKGNNKDRLGDITSVNTTNKILNDDKIKSCNAQELRNLVQKFKIARTKSCVEDSDFKNDFDMVVLDWGRNSTEIHGDNRMELKTDSFLKEIEFVNSLKCNSDFIKAIILREDSNIIWIVIKETNFGENKKYLRSAREFIKINECDFKIIIFDEKQLDDMFEQLDTYDNYKVID